MDCEASAGGSFQVVDAHDPSDDGTQPAVRRSGCRRQANHKLLLYAYQGVLFTMDGLDPASLHTLTVYNLPDIRFNHTSQMTFAILNVVVSDDIGVALVLKAKETTY
jgi:hypothetical protein